MEDESSTGKSVTGLPYRGIVKQIQ